MEPNIKSNQMKTASVITKDIIFRSDEYSGYPCKVRVEFTPDDFNRIARVQSLIKDNDRFGINSIRIDSAGYTLLNEDDGSEEDWKDEGGELIVYPESVYFYAQNKYDASDQIESEAITLEEIIAGFKDDVMEEVIDNY